MNTNVRTSSGTLLDNYIWFSNVCSNGLYRVNVDSKDIELVDFFPEEKIDARGLHKKSFAFEKKLFFIPAYCF